MTKTSKDGKRQWEIKSCSQNFLLTSKWLGKSIQIRSFGINSHKVIYLIQRGKPMT